MPPITPPENTNQYGFYTYYLNLVPDTDLISGLERTSVRLHQLVGSLTEYQLNYRYATDKWTIKEIISHSTDAERTFSYRAFRFARGNSDVIPGWDVNEFVVRAQGNQRTIEDLLEEYSTVRKATLVLFSHFTEAMLEAKGPVRDTELTVRALGYTLLGHEIHHLQVIQTRYLNELFGPISLLI